jgi:hypothetical protein
MEEKTKASKGASVTKAGNISGQSSVLKAKNNQWKQEAVSIPIDKPPPATCQDNSPENAPPPNAILAPSRPKKGVEKQDIAEQIGRQLRSVYNDVLVQPVPDRFLDLLRELEKDPK